jgi:hypothetical protein
MGEFILLELMRLGQTNAEQIEMLKVRFQTLDARQEGELNLDDLKTTGLVFHNFLFILPLILICNLLLLFCFIIFIFIFIFIGKVISSKRPNVKLSTNSMALIKARIRTATFELMSIGSGKSSRRDNELRQSIEKSSKLVKEKEFVSTSSNKVFGNMDIEIGLSPKLAISSSEDQNTLTSKSLEKFRYDHSKTSTTKSIVTFSNSYPKEEVSINNFNKSLTPAMIARYNEVSSPSSQITLGIDDYKSIAATLQVNKTTENREKRIFDKLMSNLAFIALFIYSFWALLGTLFYHFYYQWTFATSYYFAIEAG